MQVLKFKDKVFIRPETRGGGWQIDLASGFAFGIVVPSALDEHLDNQAVSVPQHGGNEGEQKSCGDVRRGTDNRKRAY